MKTKQPLSAEERATLLAATLGPNDDTDGGGHSRGTDREDRAADRRGPDGFHSHPTMTKTEQQIETLYKELRMRESAAPHLRGIPALQNQSSIDKLYDLLNALHIARIEGR